VSVAVWKLGDVCDITMGQAPDGASYNEEGRGLPLIAGAGDFGSENPEPIKFTTAPTKRCKAGDIILGIRATIGNKVLSDGEYCLGRGVASLRVGQNLNDRYLWHWLTRSRRELASKGRGATFLQVSRADIAELAIPLPPLKEQKRIAVILDKADALRRKRKRALDLLDSLIHGLVNVTFKDTSPTALIGELCDVQGGIQLSLSRANLSIEISYLRVANVHRNRLDLSEMKTMRVTRAEFERTTLSKGDILFVEGHGNANEIGRCAVWDGSLNPCIHQNHLIRARLVSRELDPLTLSYWLNSNTGRQHLLRRGKTTSGLNTISVYDVKTTPVPRLQKEKREQLRSQVERIERLKISHDMQLRRFDILFSCLQHRAFSGQL
jgi:type I restriction enzyme S subunit